MLKRSGWKREDSEWVSYCGDYAAAVWQSAEGWQLVITKDARVITKSVHPTKVEAFRATARYWMQLDDQFYSEER